MMDYKVALLPGKDPRMYDMVGTTPAFSLGLFAGLLEANGLEPNASPNASPTEGMPLTENPQHSFGAESYEPDPLEPPMGEEPSSSGPCEPGPQQAWGQPQNSVPQQTWGPGPQGMWPSQPAQPQQPPQQPQTVAQANQFFISQRQGEFNPEAPAGGNENCGPTSLAMAARSLGVNPPGTNNWSTPQQQIMATRQAMGGGTDPQQPTFVPNVLQGAQNMGLNAQQVKGMQGVNQALSQGKPVMVCGDPSGAYENKFNQGDYPRFDSGHWIVVNSRQKDGNYVVSDPWNRDGATTLTPQQLQKFMSYKNWNEGIALSRQQPQQQGQAQQTPAQQNEAALTQQEATLI
jgi:hypothetical protein